MLINSVIDYTIPFWQVLLRIWWNVGFIVTAMGTWVKKCLRKIIVREKGGSLQKLYGLLVQRTRPEICSPTAMMLLVALWQRWNFLLLSLPGWPLCPKEAGLQIRVREELVTREQTEFLIPYKFQNVWSLCQCGTLTQWVSGTQDILLCVLVLLRLPWGPNSARMVTPGLLHRHHFTAQKKKEASGTD